MMGKLELHPPRTNALAAGITETASGGLLAAGLATPLAAAGIIGTVITAIRKVHLEKGPWITNGGYEYNLVIIAAMLALSDDGPGALSADSALGIHDTGPWWAAGALAAGTAASVLTIQLGRRAVRSRSATSGGAVVAGGVAAGEAAGASGEGTEDLAAAAHRRAQ